MSNLSNLNGKVFTIINQIPTSTAVATKIAWYKHRLKKCDKKDGLYDRSNGIAMHKANTWTAYIYDWDSYVKSEEYYSLSEEEQKKVWTANIGDLIVFADISDELPKTVQEFKTLCDKYRYNGGTITSIEEYISYKRNGEPWGTNHIEVMKA